MQANYRQKSNQHHHNLFEILIRPFQIRKPLNKADSWHITNQFNQFYQFYQFNESIGTRVKTQFCVKISVFQGRNLSTIDF